MVTGDEVLKGMIGRPTYTSIVVGDVLVGHGSVVDAYRKESKRKTMTFVVVRTDWSDQATGDPVVTSTYNVIHRA
jgi:N-terminal half of MaoC dehydratase